MNWFDNSTWRGDHSTRSISAQPDASPPILGDNVRTYRPIEQQKRKKRLSPGIRRDFGRYAEFGARDEIDRAATLSVWVSGANVQARPRGDTFRSTNVATVCQPGSAAKDLSSIFSDFLSPRRPRRGLCCMVFAPLGSFRVTSSKEGNYSNVDGLQFGLNFCLLVDYETVVAPVASAYS